MTRMTLADAQFYADTWGYHIVVNGDMMLAGVFCGEHFLYMVDLG